MTYEIVERNAWASVFATNFVAFLCFTAIETAPSIRIGWWIYGAGWTVALVMFVACAIRRRSPGAGGAGAFVALVIFGALFYANHA
ncbi:hypothetical protein G5C51_17685 [Streptomyces sp. A7024]|uniref:Integral membrane protein n=1 Tax=Streptomyces coryli TaxID=1128680 RepID=A0A6G4U0P9_9ACTN|nr:hypothetical protein [Streptomyces coryli]NGN65724.1 hypothetical protein [Streptomyces coryli]